MELLNCLGFLAAIGVLSFLAGRLLPKRWFHAERFPFRLYAFEQYGRIYEKLQIKKWQNKLLDMSRVFPRIMPAKKLGTDYETQLPIMIQETCVAELTHLFLCFAGFYCVKLWPGVGGTVAGTLFAAGNVPFILIQRYNRPRLTRLLDAHQKKHSEIGLAVTYENPHSKLQYRRRTQFLRQGHSGGLR